MPPSAPPPEPDPELQDSLELVRHAQDGELVAYGELFARYYPRVRAIVRKRIGEGLRKGMDSEDLLQEAMLDAIRGFEGFEVRSRRELIGWFAKIVENGMRSANRRLHAQKRDRSKEVPLQYVSAYLDQSAADFQPAANTPGPHELAAEQEQMQILEASLGDLEPAHRRVIELRHGRNLAWSAIASELERPSADAARMLYARARIELQKAMRIRGADSR